MLRADAVVGNVKVHGHQGGVIGNPRDDTGSGDYVLAQTCGDRGGVLPFGIAKVVRAENFVGIRSPGGSYLLNRYRIRIDLKVVISSVDIATESSCLFQLGGNGRILGQLLRHQDINQLLKHPALVGRKGNGSIGGGQVIYNGSNNIVGQFVPFVATPIVVAQGHTVKDISVIDQQAFYIAIDNCSCICQ